MPAGEPDVLEVQARPLPDSALEAIAGTREITERTHDSIDQLTALLGGKDKPARLETIVLTAATPRKMSDSRQSAKSIAVYVHNGAGAAAGGAVWLGVGGGAAGPAQHGIRVAVGALVVLPISVEDVELALDPAAVLGGGDEVLVHIFRFDSVQAPFVGGA